MENSLEPVPTVADIACLDSHADTSLIHPHTADLPLRVVVVICRFSVTRALEDSLQIPEDPLMLSLPTSSHSVEEDFDSQPRLLQLFSNMKPSETPAISGGSKTRFRKRAATAKKSRVPVPDERQVYIKAYFSDLVDGPIRKLPHAASQL